MASNSLLPKPTTTFLFPILYSFDIPTIIKCFILKVHDEKTISKIKFKNIQDELKKLIKEVMPDVNTDEVTADSQLVEDLHFDSLAVMMLAMNIEDAYKITFDGPMNFKTVGDVIAYVENAKK